MKLYFAGNAVSVGAQAMFLDWGLQYRLLSYAEIDTWCVDAFDFWVTQDVPAPLFLDSGAFGAYTRGHVIDIDRYIAYIQQHPGKFYPYAALDVIGSAEGSRENYEYMLAQGITPMPTFHMGSKMEELHALLKMSDYVALGGVVGATEDQQRPWFDKCWRVIRDYFPVKVHAFGVMAQWALERYPWYSADSSSALVGAGMGRVTSFKLGRISNDTWTDYARKTWDGSVIDRESSVSAKNGSAWRGRAYLNIQAQLQLQRYVTDLWALRGITWEDTCAASTAPSDLALIQPS